jgi:hypothetical protein
MAKARALLNKMSAATADKLAVQLADLARADAEFPVARLADAVLEQSCRQGQYAREFAVAIRTVAETLPGPASIEWRGAVQAFVSATAAPFAPEAVAAGASTQDDGNDDAQHGSKHHNKHDQDADGAAGRQQESYDDFCDRVKARGTALGRIKTLLALARLPMWADACATVLVWFLRDYGSALCKGIIADRSSQSSSSELELYLEGIDLVVKDDIQRSSHGVHLASTMQAIRAATEAAAPGVVSKRLCFRIMDVIDEMVQVGCFSSSDKSRPADKQLQSQVSPASSVRGESAAAHASTISPCGSSMMVLTRSNSVLSTSNDADGSGMPPTEQGRRRRRRRGGRRRGGRGRHSGNDEQGQRPVSHSWTSDAGATSMEMRWWHRSGPMTTDHARAHAVEVAAPKRPLDTKSR